jgi:hypothetical protein
MGLNVEVDVCKEMRQSDPRSTEKGSEMSDAWDLTALRIPPLHRRWMTLTPWASCALR